MRRSLYVLPFSLLAAAAGAQERPDTIPGDSVPIRIEGVVATGVRTSATTGGTSAIIVNPDSLHVVAAPTMDQVLREIPFVGVRQNSRGEAEITMRGSESRQVAVLLDGVPLTLGWDHRTDPSVIPLTGSQSITVIRGLHSVLYGPNVLGGVINVGVSQAPAQERPTEVRFRAGFDQFGSTSVGAAGGQYARLGSGDFTVRLGAGYRDRPGFALSEEVRDTLTLDDDLRANSDLDHLDGFLALRYQGDGGAWMGLSSSAYRAEHGVPPELHVEEPRLWRYPDQSRLLTALSGGTGHRRTLFGGTGDVEFSVGLNAGSTKIESFSSPAYETVEGTEGGDDRTLTLRLMGDHSLGGATTLSGALTYADVTYDERINDDPAAHYRQRLWSAATEITSTVLDGTRLSAGLVMDGADTPESGGREPLGALSAWGARLGVSSNVLGDRLRLHAAANRRSRFPALRELYSGALGRFRPNPDLKPETLVGVEGGATGTFGGVEVQAVGFHHRLSDAVLRITLPNRQFFRVNRDEVRSTGLELLGNWRRGRFSLMGDLMLQDIAVEDPTAGDLRHPENQPELRAGLDAAIPLPFDLRAIVNQQVTGEQFCVHPDLGSEVSTEGGYRADLGVERSWSLGRGALLRTLRTSLSLDNATDSAVYEQCGLPQPGRTLRFGVEIL